MWLVSLSFCLLAFFLFYLFPEQVGHCREGKVEERGRVKGGYFVVKLFCNIKSNITIVYQ